jgi:tetratricopeptide (TPR) repeat protein
MLGKLNEAIECFDKALEINPNHIYARFFKSITLGDLGKYNEAEDELTETLKRISGIHSEKPPQDSEHWCSEEFEFIYLHWLKEVSNYIVTLSSINESIMERMKKKI